MLYWVRDKKIKEGMKEFIEQFEQRKQEVNLYFEFLKKQIGEEISPKNQDIDTDKIEKILKANSFLILYNFIESSMRNAIQAIHDSIETEAVPYRLLEQGLQKIYLKQLYHRLKESNNSTFESSMIPFLEKIIDDAFIKEYNQALTFSGNVDAQKIRELARDYGFSNTSGASRGGRELLTVKTKRNHLAHGNISFSECGRDHSFSDLNTIKDEVIGFLRDILSEIEDYIDKQTYKKGIS